MAEIVNTPYFAQQFFGLDGKPLVNGKLAFFENNTDVPASVYTSGGSTALGSEITLDSSGFPETQFALEAGKNYTVKAFDADNVLIWTRNDVFGGGDGGGISGEYIPMEGTTADDPVRGPLVWNDANGKNTIQSNQIRIDGSNNFNYLSPSQVWIYTPTAQSQLYSNELDISSTQVGRAGTAKIRNDYIQYSKPSNTAVSYFAPNNVQLTNSVGSEIYMTTDKLAAYESARIDISASNGSNMLRLLCNDNNLAYSEITSKKVLRILSDEHVYLSGTHVHIQSTASSGTNDVIIASEYGDVQVSTNNGTLQLFNTKLDFNEASGAYATGIVDQASVDTSNPNDHGLITEAAAVSLLSGGGSVSTADGVQGDGTDLDPITLKLDATGNVTLTQGPDGLKADYSADDEAAEYYSYPFTMTTHLLSRPAEMLMVPVHVDWSSTIRSVKFYNGTLGGASTPYMVILYHSIGDINTPGSYLEPFGYYYKSDSSSDIVKGWNTKALTFRGENNTWDETEYLSTNGEEIFVGFWSRDSIGIPYIEGYADKAMGCEYTAWGSIPTLATVKTDIQVSSVYALVSHIHMILTSEEAS